MGDIRLASLTSSPTAGPMNRLFMFFTFYKQITTAALTKRCFALRDNMNYSNESLGIITCALKAIDVNWLILSITSNTLNVGPVCGLWHRLSLLTGQSGDSVLFWLNSSVCSTCLFITCWYTTIQNLFYKMHGLRFTQNDISIFEYEHNFSYITFIIYWLFKESFLHSPYLL